MSIYDLFNKYIKDTKYKENIIISRIFVCVLEERMQKVMGNIGGTVFMSTRSLKHIYDRHIFEKKMSDDFYLILDNFFKIIKNPDKIYKNKVGKRGHFLFTKEIVGVIYIITIEIINDEELEIVSIFTSGEKYLSKFTLLWS